tara:strand:- start:777 stop:947 length:171 start_codon:yes stop_codon:yes gene_type:complete
MLPKALLGSNAKIRFLVVFIRFYLVAMFPVKLKKTKRQYNDTSQSQPMIYIIVKEE